MKKIEVKTRKGTREPQYSQNNDVATVFLRHDDDKITVKNNEQIEIEVYDNGACIFIGSKTEFFKKLKTEV